MAIRGLFALSLGVASGACVMDDPSLDSESQEVTSSPILLPHSGTGQQREVMSSFDPLVITLHDTYGDPLAGARVQFSAPISGASAWFTGNGTVETDELGRAEITPYATSIAGTYLVQAYVNDADPVPFVLTNTAAAPASLLPVAGSNQASVVGLGFSAALTVAVYDSYGNPVVGAPVTFTAPTSGATAQLPGEGRAVTGTDGRASITATAGTIAGTYDVTASVAGAPAMPFVLANVLAPAPPIVTTTEFAAPTSRIGTAAP
ncbi:MAG: Ig-like domain-containing protein [Myxococcota bacterium]|nr:Ig-like domain-containing protein [Myxococcota bacterium]